MKTRLPVLEDLRIAAPCNADWDEMAGDDQVRFCGKCEKNVYNLSAMSRGDAEGLVREREGRLCVRFYQRQDGMVLTSDCPVGVRKQRLRQRVWASVSGFAASAMLVLGAWCGRARADLTLRDGGKQPVHHQPLTMGAVAIGPRPSPQPAPVVGQVVAPPRAVLMGKIAMPPQPRLNQGGPVAKPFMGDVSDQ